MSITRESSIPLGFVQRGSEPSHLTDTIAVDLAVGDYLIKYRIRPVIFIRVEFWDKELEVDQFNPEEAGIIQLSDHTIFTLTEEELSFYFDDDVQLCRIVLIGEQGYSSFKISLNNLNSLK